MQNEKSSKNKRCPNNTRRNPNTGTCDPLTDITKNANMRRQKTKKTSTILPKTRSKITLQNNYITITEDKKPTPSRPLEIKELDPEKISSSNVLSIPDIIPQKELPIIKNTKKRCPNGTRRNPKTRICENIRIKSPKIYKKVTFTEPILEPPITASTETVSAELQSKSPESIIDEPPITASTEPIITASTEPIITASTETVTAELQSKSSESIIDESPITASTETVSAELQSKSSESPIDKEPSVETPPY
jgi:hypothetical protein